MSKQIILAFFLLTFSVAASPAQTKPEQSADNTRDQFFDIKNRSVELERAKREANKSTANTESITKFPEIKEDFEQIQKINSNIIKLISVETPTNYASVLKFVSEINRRATRLKSNLFPAEPKTKNKQQTADQSPDITTLASELDEAVNNFVHSSIFQNTKLVNSEDSLKAQKDLEAVINFSYALKLKIKD